MYFNIYICNQLLTQMQDEEIRFFLKKKKNLEQTSCHFYHPLA